MELVTFDRDRTIYREGEEGRAMYVIRSGKVAILSGYGKVLSQQPKAGTNAPKGTRVELTLR